MSSDSPAPKRLFLSWSDNACSLVAKQLLSLGHADPERPCVVVVPTRESVRLLREQLAIQSAAQAHQRAYLSPRIMPLSQLMQGNLACPSTGSELLLWHQLLGEEGGKKSNLYPHGKEFSSENWLREAKQKIDLLHKLSMDGLDVDSQSWQQLAESDERWLELGELQNSFRHKIHALGLSDKTEEHPCLLATGTSLIFAAVPQIPQAVRKMLSKGDYPIEIWIHAKPEQADMFDDWGCPTEAWLKPCSSEELGLDRPDWREHYILAADLWKMAELAGQRAAAINAQNPVPHQVAFAACDAEMEPSIEEELTHHGAAVYRPRGLAFSSSSWHKLLRELLSIIDALKLAGLKPQESVDYYPAPVIIRLLKWPSMLNILADEPIPSARIYSMITALDEVQFCNIPVYVTSLQGQLKKMKPPAAKDCATFIKLICDELSRAFTSPQSLLNCLTAWVLKIHTLDPQQAKLNEYFLSQLLQLAPFISKDSTSCRDLLLLIQLSCKNHATPYAREGMSLDLLGWMELNFSPAQYMVITGMHNGIIPEKSTPDALLTTTAMEALSMPSDEQTAARDAYLLRSVIAGRGISKTYFTFSLYDGKQNPLSPSSLLLRLCPEEKLAEFATHFFAEHDDIPRSAVLKADSSGWQLKPLHLNQPEQGNKLAQLSCASLGLTNPMAGKHFSPSTLRQFLQCPLRFWLMKLNKLDSNSVEEEKKNLNAQEIGTFLHAVLEQFIRLYPSRAAAVKAGKEEQLEQELLRIFEEKYQPSYGKNNLLPQEIQREGMRNRLKAYLLLHLQMWDEGWECARDHEGKLILEYEVEWKLGEHTLKMVIDRVDCKQWKDGSYAYRVLDYKTGHIDDCFKEHLTAYKQHELLEHHFGELFSVPFGPWGNSKKAALRWTNLQLPLYAAWLQNYLPKAELSVGYIHLSSKAEEVSLKLWESKEARQGLFSSLLCELNPDHIETLMDSAMEWASACMHLISQGQCFIPAEQLQWGIKRDYLFEELTDIQNIEELFITH